MLKIIGIVIAALCIFLTALFIYHRICLSKEKDLLTPLGEMVEVDGAKMSVYTEGEGDKTLVFLSGSGTVSPILDFKMLYSELSDEYKIVVVERFGYGFSDITDKSRDVDTILENDREALAAAGLEAPYVLCPHSMSGIEALYWAQKYPDEVAAIISLDMAVPKAYEQMDVGSGIFSMRVIRFLVNAGVGRIGNLSDLLVDPAITGEEREIYREIAYTRFCSNDMLNEGNSIKDSAAMISGTTSVPILMFVSDGSDIGDLKEDWRGIQSDFAEENGAEIIYLDCGHYVHHFEAEKIAEEIKEFLQ